MNLRLLPRVLCIFAACGFAFGSLAQPTTKPSSIARPPIVSARQWGSQPQPIGDDHKHTPQFITIHHAGELWTGKKTPEEYLRAMQKWGQREKGWPDLPYHFLIAPDGRIFEGRPIAYEPQSNTNYSLAGNIGVELFGNFEEQRPSAEQLRSCVKLCAWLAAEQHIDEKNIRGHKDAAPGQTVCPGKDFYRYLESGDFPRWVRETTAGLDPHIEAGEPLPDGPTAPIPTTQPN
jgi:N-acetyl-anhydromuramyl-L-alanine amidase AmpD